MGAEAKLFRYATLNLAAIGLAFCTELTEPASAQHRWGDHPAMYDACGRMLSPPVVNGRVDFKAIEATPEFKASTARASELGWEAAAKRDKERSQLRLPPLTGEALRRAVIEDSNRIARQIEQEEMVECNPAIAGMPAALDDQNKKIKDLERKLDDQARELDDAKARIMEQELRPDD